MSIRIFVTVGTQLPFDRLIDAVDAWAAANPRAEVFAQIGSGRAPRHCDHAAHISGAEFGHRVAAADIVVAHAGMGTLLMALDLGRPLVVFPRSAALGEHRNEHQRATVAKLGHLASLSVVESSAELAAALDRLGAFGCDGRQPSLSVSPARRALIDGIRSFSGLERSP